MNENTRMMLKQVSGWILPGLGLVTLASVALGGVALAFFGAMGLMVFGSDGFFGFALLLGFVVTILGLILTAQRFFQLQKKE